MKKLLCVTLSVLLLLLSFPMTAFATSQETATTLGNPGTHTLTTLDNQKLADTATTWVCRIGDGTDEATTTYYSTLAAAIEAATKATDTADAAHTVTLIRDVDTTLVGDYYGINANTKNYSLQGNGVHLILDGNGFTATTLGSGDEIMFWWKSGSITLKNATLEANRVIRADADSEAAMNVTIENCTLNGKTNHVVYIRGEVAGGNGVLTVNNSIINATGTINDTACIFQLGATKANWDITVHNSQLNNNTASGNVNAVIKLLSSAYETTLKLTGNTELNMGATGTNSNNGIWISSGSAACTVEIGEDVTFNARPTADNVSRFFHNERATAVIKDAGATYTANANAQKNGITLPSGLSAASNGKTVYGWTISGSSDKIKVGTTYTNEEATDTVTFSPVFEEIAYATDAEAIAGGMTLAVRENGVTTGYYASFSEAVTAAKDGATISLLADVSGNYTFPTTGRTLTVEGNSKNWAGSGYFIDNLGYNNITFNNINFSSTHGPSWSATNSADLSKIADNSTMTTTFNNCTFSMVGAGDQNGFRLKNGTQDTKIAAIVVNFNGCTINYNNRGRIFLLNDCPDMTLNLHDTVVNQIGRGKNDYDAFFFVETACVTEINVTGSSELNATPGEFEGVTSNALTTYTTQSVFYGTAAAVANITLGEGVKVLLGTNSTETTTYSFVNPACPNFTVKDEGAVWAVTPAVAAKGFTLPSVTPAEGETFLGWNVNGALYGAGSAVPATEVTEKLPVTLVTFNADDFKMITGASIRTQSPIGIRFGVQISEELAAMLGDSATYGTIIAPASYLGAPEDFTVAKMLNGAYATVEQTALAEAENGVITYYAALVDLEPTYNAVTMRFAARGYVTVTYADGTTGMIYTAFNTTDHVRSMYDVATNLKAQGVTNAILEQILELGGAQA